MLSLAKAKLQKSRIAFLFPSLAALGAGMLAGIPVVGGLQAAGIVVSQKGRMFHPDSLSVKKGETIIIVNDDSDLLHHAYIESPTFSFDSGDQDPGAARLSSSPSRASSKCCAAFTRR